MGEVMDEVEQVIDESGFLINAPFRWVGLVFRFGARSGGPVYYQRIDKKYGDLPVAIELDAHEVSKASREELKRLFLIATLRVLVHIAIRYDRPGGEAFATMLAELDQQRGET